MILLHFLLSISFQVLYATDSLTPNADIMTIIILQLYSADAGIAHAFLIINSYTDTRAGLRPPSNCNFLAVDTLLILPAGYDLIY